MGRDHTLYAKVPGYVRFYEPSEALSTVARSPPAPQTLPLKAPQRHEVRPLSTEAVRPHPSSRRRTRRYVGVVLRQDAKLPRAQEAPRARLFDRIDLNELEREKNLRRSGIEPLALDPALV